MHLSLHYPSFFIIAEIFLSLFLLGNTIIEEIIPSCWIFSWYLHLLCNKQYGRSSVEIQSFLVKIKNTSWSNQFEVISISSFYCIILQCKHCLCLPVIPSHLILPFCCFALQTECFVVAMLSVKKCIKLTYKAPPLFIVVACLCECLRFIWYISVQFINP